MERGDRRAAVRDRVCGIEIGKAGMAATIRVPSGKDSARRRAGTCSFGTAKKEVLALADWLRCLQVPAVGAGGGYRDACGPIARLRLGRNHPGSTPGSARPVLAGKSHERCVAGHGVSQAHLFQLG